MSRSLGWDSRTERSPIRMSPPARFGKPGNDVEQRGLAAAGGTEQNEELAAFERDVDALQRFHLAVALWMLRISRALIAWIPRESRKGLP